MESFLKKRFKKHNSVKTSSAMETKASGFAFAGILKHGDVVALSGGLGAGKTHFVKGAAKFFGISGKQIVSPTFSLVKSHKGRGVEVFHFDFYRLKGIEELEKTGYRDFLLEADSIVFVEWPEIVRETWNDFTHAVKIEHTGGNSRAITIYGKSGK
jgi:tRNA threonylcarbamoyladenosine biosynthesis protein TsaE